MSTIIGSKLSYGVFQGIDKNSRHCISRRPYQHSLFEVVGGFHTQIGQSKYPSYGQILQVVIYTQFPLYIIRYLALQFVAKS